MLCLFGSSRPRSTNAHSEANIAESTTHTHIDIYSNHLNANDFVSGGSGTWLITTTTKQAKIYQHYELAQHSCPSTHSIVDIQSSRTVAVLTMAGYTIADIATKFAGQRNKAAIATSDRNCAFNNERNVLGVLSESGRDSCGISKGHKIPESELNTLFNTDMSPAEVTMENVLNTDVSPAEVAIDNVSDDQISIISNLSGHGRGRYGDMEFFLYQWFLNQRAEQTFITKDMVKENALRFHKMLQPSGSEFKASDAWLNGFKKRYSITKRIGTIKCTKRGRKSGIDVVPTHPKIYARPPLASIGNQKVTHSRPLTSNGSQMVTTHSGPYPYEKKAKTGDFGGDFGGDMM